MGQKLNKKSNSILAKQLQDRPKLLGDRDAQEERKSHLNDPHMKPLNGLVEAIRKEKGGVPDFDPSDGGVRSEILFLLEAPGRKARGSGFVSRNNPDETASKFFELNKEAGIERDRTITWNIVPWYIGTDSKIRSAKMTDIKTGIPFLERLLARLPKLRAVVLLGRKSQQASSCIACMRPDLRIFECPHPGPQSVNPKNGNEEKIADTLREVARFLDQRV